MRELILALAAGLAWMASAQAAPLTPKPLDAVSMADHSVLVSSEQIGVARPRLRDLGNTTRS
jgi:hypothetical protein